MPRKKAAKCFAIHVARCATEYSNHDLGRSKSQVIDNKSGLVLLYTKLSDESRNLYLSLAQRDSLTGFFITSIFRREVYQ